MNEFEAFQIAVYIDTSYVILRSIKEMSVIKLAFFAYSINKSRFFEKQVYNARHSRDVVTKEISTISGDFDGFVNSMPFILKSIDILNRRGIVDIVENIVHLQDESYQAVYCNSLSVFEKNAINSSLTWSDRRFVREVLHNV